MTPQLIICLIIFACTIVTYCSGKFKLGLVAMTSLFLLSVTGCLDAKSALSNFANSNVIMIAAMCVVAAGFQRTAFCTNVANAIAGVAKGSLVAVVMGYTVIGVILSQFIQSPVTVFSISPWAPVPARWFSPWALPPSSPAAPCPWAPAPPWPASCRATWTAITKA